MKNLTKQKREILLLNAGFILLGIFPYIGLLVIPFIFVFNLVKGFQNRKINKDISIVYFICAFVAPLIGTSLCGGIYYGFIYLLSHKS